MTPCEDCTTNRQRFNPACLQCGGRYLRAIQRQPIPAAEKQAWLRKALADWCALGHDEQELRTLGMSAKKE